jgi:hypothetical protein
MRDVREAISRGATLCRHRAGVFALCAAISAVGRLPAQEIHGVVRDSAMGRPIAGALVSLLDSATREVARTLTDRDGRYTLTLSRGGLRIQVLHIGHLPRDVPVGPLGDSRTFDITMPRVPELLDAMNTTGSRPFGEIAICPARTDETRALAYWNQARMEAQDAFVVRDSSPGPVRLAIFYRDVEPSGRITHESVIVHNDSSANPALAARSSLVFPEVGRLHDSHLGASQSVVYGAGIDLLIDDHFTRRHCFRMAPTDSQHRGEIGVAFAPGQSQLDFPDMQGVLWIDPSERAVRTVEFTYVSNFSPTPLAGNLGGTLNYRLLPSGAGLIESWSERLAPEDFYRRGMKSILTSPIATLETGAELLSAAWPDSVHWSSSTGLTGRLSCSRTGVGAPNVQLRLDGTDYATTTDVTGTFRFDAVVPGPYRVTASSADMAKPREDIVDVMVVRDSLIHLALTTRAPRCGPP